MPTTDPMGRRNPRLDAEEQQNLEYLKGVAKAPLGWPAAPPTTAYIDPSDIKRMLEQIPQRGPRNPWLNLRNVAIVAILFAILIAVIVALL